MRTSAKAVKGGAYTQTQGTGFGPASAAPGMFPGAEGPYMGGGEVRTAEAHYGGRVEQTWQAQADGRAVQAALVNNNTAQAEATLRRNPHVGVTTSDGTTVYGADAARVIEEHAIARLARSIPREVNVSALRLPPPPVDLTGPPRVEVADVDVEAPRHGIAAGGASENIAARSGIDHAAHLRAQLTGQGGVATDGAANQGVANRGVANVVNMNTFIAAHGEPPLPPLSEETLRRFAGGTVRVVVGAGDTPQTAALRQLQMTVAGVGQQGRLSAEEQEGFVERWRAAAAEGLYTYEADGTKRAWTAEEFRAAQERGSIPLELRAEWQPGMVADLRRMLEDSEAVRTTTSAARMTDAERIAAGRREAEQQIGDFYRIQANVGIGLFNSTLQMLSMQPGLKTRTEDGREVQIEGHAPRLPTLELQSEYFRGTRGEVLQTAATLGAGLIAGGGAIPSRTQGLNLPRPQNEQTGVYFFGERALPYIDRAEATLGRAGETHFFMPLQDARIVRNASDATRHTGNAPSVLEAYVNDRPVYGIAFPTRGLSVRSPMTDDAGGYLHFLEGGRTAVRTANPNGGYLINTTRELVTPGGQQMPKSVLKKSASQAAQHQVDHHDLDHRLTR